MIGRVIEKSFCDRRAMPQCQTQLLHEWIEVSRSKAVEIVGRDSGSSQIAWLNDEQVSRYHGPGFLLYARRESCVSTKI